MQQSVCMPTPTQSIAINRMFEFRLPTDQVGRIQGAHGIKGEVKVRSSTDFAVTRLCTPGTKHIKAPNRRFPRDIELLEGRWQKEEIFLLKLEVSHDAFFFLETVFNTVRWMTCSVAAFFPPLTRN